MALLDLDVPIVLGPFGGMSSVALTAAVSEAGGLGSYGLYGYGAERIADTAAQLRAATDRPFALNLWVPIGDEVEPGDVDLGPALELVAPLYAELGLALPTAAPERFLPDFDEQFEAALEARPAFLSFVFGIPDAAALAEAKARGIRIIGTATTVAERACSPPPEPTPSSRAASRPADTASRSSAPPRSRSSGRSRSSRRSSTPSTCR